MSDPQQRYAGNWIQRFGRGAVDRLLPGNQRAADGTLNNSAVVRGLITRGGQALASMYGGPLAGLAVNQAGTNWTNNGNPLNFADNSSRLGQLVDAFTNRGGSSPGYMPIQRSTFPVSLGSYGKSSGPDVQPSTPSAWTPLGTPTGNVIASGGSLGSWANAPARGGHVAGSGLVGRGGAGVIAGDAARASFAGMKDSIYGARQIHNYLD